MDPEMTTHSNRRNWRPDGRSWPFHSLRSWPFAEGGEATIALTSLLASAAMALSVKRPNFGARLLAAGAVAVWLLILYFFRDPERQTLDEPGLVVSAGDGEVVEIVDECEASYLHSRATRISVFLSIFDVHVQRIPISGSVTAVQHQPGKFLQAFRPEASTENEHISMLIESDYGPVLVKQIAGIMARRCVNNTQTGQMVHVGQRYGMIKFGSRVDLFVPPEAQLLVKVGDKVAGGLTPIAILAKKNATPETA